MSEDKRICLGYISGAHGIRGDVIIRSYTVEPLSIGSYGALEDEAGHRRFELSDVRVAGKGVIARINDMPDRNQAEALIGTKLFVARDQLPPPSATTDEWYLVDLIGLAVELAAGLVGKVVDVVNYGAGDLIEIKLDDVAETVLMPFTKEFVPVIDVAGGRIVINPPAGLFDETSNDG